MLAGSLAFVAAVLEIGLRLVQPGPPEKLSPQITHEYVARDAALGRLSDYYLMTPGQQAYHLNVAVSTNALGLRNPEVSAEKRPGCYRIVALGDSHTFGFGVEEHETWPRLLERKLRERWPGRPGRPGRDLEVINAGVQALAVEQEIQLFKDKLLAVKPDLVLLAYYWNDMPIQGDPAEPWPDAEEMIPLSMRDKAPSGQANAAQQPPGLVDWAKGLVRKSYLVYYVVQKAPGLQMKLQPTIETKWKRAILTGEQSSRIDASWRFVEKQLVELKTLSKEHGFDVAVLVIPFFEQMTSTGYDEAAYQTVLERIGQRRDIPVINPLAAIQASRPSYPKCFIPFDGHPNGLIYEIVADEAASYLLKRSAP